MTPSEIFARADDVLQDTSFVRWPQAERLRYLNDGRREMAVIRPDIYATTDVVTLVAGTKQALPAGRSRLFDVVRNINSDTNGFASVWKPTSSAAALAFSLGGVLVPLITK